MIDNEEESDLPLIGRDIPFEVVDGEMLKVEHFNQYSTVKRGKVKAFSAGMPYGALEVESSSLKGLALLPILHKEDFLHVWQAIEDRGVNKQEELNVIWTNTRYKNKVFAAMSSAMPKLIVMINPKNANRVMHESSYKPHLTGRARYVAMAPIVELKPKVMW